MALEGTLKDFPLPDILQLIGLQKKTGLLHVESNVEKITLGFDKGCLVMASSADPEAKNRLGEILLRAGKLSLADLQGALLAQVASPRRLGSILLSQGTCSLDDIADGVTAQMQHAMFHAFRLQYGEFFFDTDVTVEYDTGTVQPISIDRLLMEAAQISDEWPIIEKVIPAANLVFRKTTISTPVTTGNDDFDLESSLFDFAEDTNSIRLSKRIYKVYELIDGQLTVEEIFNRALLSEFECYKAFYELLQQGLIEKTLKNTGSLKSADALPLVENFLNQTAGIIPARGREAIRAVPPNLAARAILAVVTLSDHRLVMMQDDAHIAGLPDVTLSLLQQVNGLCGATPSGAFECVYQDFGIAILWNRDADYALLMADVLPERNAVSRFRSQVATVARRLLPVQEKS